MSVIPELAYIQKSSCELLFFAAPPIEGPLNFYLGISIEAFYVRAKAKSPQLRAHGRYTGHGP